MKAASASFARRLDDMRTFRALVRDSSGSACLRTALAVGATALLPALGWEAGEGNRAMVTAVAPPAALTASAPATTTVTIVGKQGVTWTHAKADRMPTAQPESVLEIVNLAEAGASVEDGRPEILEEGSADPIAQEVARAEFSGWLAFDETSGSMRITGFDTLREPIGRKACRARHDVIVRAFELSPGKARVLADQPVMFQSRLCAANGEIVITCQGSDAVISPRHTRPGSACTRI
jgi:hypothetical protein